jgi:mannose-6-phosphate isomerase-like protein (cupin superfamily)
MSAESGRKVKVTRLGEGRAVRVVGDAYRLLAGSDDTDGGYMVMEAAIPPGAGPPLHVHAREDEGFYVLEGELEFVADGATLRAGAGTFLNLPKGSRHRFQNTGDRPARMLIMCAPGGIESFFIEADGQGPEALGAIAARYGITILPG